MNKHSPWIIYDSLISQAQSEVVMKDITLGINWSVAEFDFDSDSGQPGICFSPHNVQRTLPWSGSLIGKSLTELSPWIKSWEPAAAVVGALAINSAINSTSGLIEKAEDLSRLFSDVASNLSVFRYFEKQVMNQTVTVIGSYPDIHQIRGSENWNCIERHPRLNELPDPAAKYILADSDWVFITAASIPNKTLPLLLEYSEHAHVVLMGPSLPWTPLWAEFGVNYLAGVEVVSKRKLNEVARQAGGTQLFEQSCCYKILKI